MILYAAMMLMVFVVFVYIIGGVIGWYVIKFIFGWGMRHCNWTEYPNLNGVLFLASVLGGYLLISLLVGSISLSNSRSMSPWDPLLQGMAITGSIIVSLVLIGVGIFVAVGLIGNIINWITRK